jgi:hypothetical protein
MPGTIFISHRAEYASLVRELKKAIETTSLQKNAKIPPPLSATTKLDFVFTRPRPRGDIRDQLETRAA